MITMGFNTLAMLTYGLGIRMPWYKHQEIRRKPKIEFRNKPPGVVVEEKGGPTDFEGVELHFEDESIGFEDK